MSIVYSCGEGGQVMKALIIAQCGQVLKASNAGWSFRNEFLKMEKSELFFEEELRAIWMMKHGRRSSWRHRSEKSSGP